MSRAPSTPSASWPEEGSSHGRRKVLQGPAVGGEHPPGQLHLPPGSPAPPSSAKLLLPSSIPTASQSSVDRTSGRRASGRRASADRAGRWGPTVVSWLIGGSLVVLSPRSPPA